LIPAAGKLLLYVSAVPACYEPAGRGRGRSLTWAFALWAILGSNQ